MKKYIVYLEDPTTREDFDGGCAWIESNVIIKTFYSTEEFHIEVGNKIAEEYYSDQHTFDQHNNSQDLRICLFDKYGAKEVSIEDYYNLMICLNKDNKLDMYISNKHISIGNYNLKEIVIPNGCTLERINEYDFKLHI